MANRVSSMWTSRVLLLLLVTFVGNVNAKAQAAAMPPVPFEDEGACPFEGCVYRQWRARTPVEILEARRSNAPVAFRVKPGERVTALTGVVVTLRAGRVRFNVPQRLTSSAGPIEVLPEQTLYLLTYQGEGKVWFNGRVYEDVGVSSFINDACGDSPSRCTGRVVEPSRTEWWVQIRNNGGQMGWTREPDKFDGKDALGE
jgi:hypothetical protein